MSSEHKFKDNEVFRERYIKFMLEYVELEYMSVINKLLKPLKMQFISFIIDCSRKKRTTVALRVIFDASIKNNRGTTLNGTLLIELLQDN